MKLKLFGLLILCAHFALGQTSIIAYSSSWKYYDQGVDQGTSWRSSSFDDVSWATANASFGYADAVTTCVKPGAACGAVNCSPSPTTCSKYITYYFRKKVNIVGLSNYPDFTFNLIRDDGAVVYVNGVEVIRSNMPTGTILASTLASTAATEGAVYSSNISSSYFVEGENTIAVEVHQTNATSTDLFFDMEVLANSASVSRGPYLQMGNQTEVTVRWRTNAALTSKLEVGTVYGSYPMSVTSNTATTEHELRITGLTPDTKYFYRVGTSTDVLEQSTDMYFTTAPDQNTTRKIGIAVFGDCGRNDNSFRTNSINYYKSYVGSNTADLLLLLGDNAYTNGTEAEYTSNFFAPMSPTILKNHVLFPSPGNHDYYSTSQALRTGAYYQNFTMPTNGECGGVPSGTEAFYSFNWGDIHFISLDSYGTEAGATRLYDTLGPQVTWLKDDLEANTRKWVVAFWHHPPYTMGSHNSDTEAELINIRSRFIRILERYGVDLILCGHSHDYERSYLMKGHYGLESTFSTSTHAVSNSSGKYDGTTNSCPYVVPSGKTEHGTVYVVAGSSGADGGVQTGYPHNAFPFSIDDGGMLYLEVEGNRLDAKFLRRNSTIGDQFTIMKDVNRTVSVTTTAGSPVTLEASWVGNYAWTTGENAVRSINITPATPGVQTIYASDNTTTPCIADTFQLTVTAQLPVSLIDFKAERAAGKVNLSWVTTNETGNHHFGLEKSFNGNNFKEFAQVKPKHPENGTAIYSFTDDESASTAIYYRLYQKDVDGKLTYLGIRKVPELSKSNVIEMQVNTVNPAGGNLTISLRSGKPRSGEIIIYAANGKIAHQKRVQITEQKYSTSLSLPVGSYVVNFIGDDGLKSSRKIAIAN